VASCTLRKGTSKGVRIFDSDPTGRTALSGRRASCGLAIERDDTIATNLPCSSKSQDRFVRR
jgi:hypothetical protein